MNKFVNIESHIDDNLLINPVLAFRWFPYSINSIYLQADNYLSEFNTEEGRIKVLKNLGLNNTINWNEYSNLNNYKSSGNYDLIGIKNSENDNIPINNSGLIRAKLTVLENEGIVTQLLYLNNYQGGEGNIYIRSCQNGEWKPWGKLLTNVEVGVINQEQLDALIDNGIYSGILSTTGETFVIICINNYVIALQVGVQHISHLKYSLVAVTGEIKIEKRTRDAYGFWTEWETIKGGVEVDVTEAVKAQGLPTLIEQGFAKEGVTYKVVCAAYEVPEIDNNNKIKEHIESKRHSLDDTVILSMKCYTHYGEISIVIDSIICGYQSSYFKYIISSINTEGEEVKVSEDMTVL